MIIDTCEDLFVPIDSFKQISLGINEFLELLVELLGVRSDVLNAPRFHMLLDFVPVFSVDAQGLEEQVVLFHGPAATIKFSLSLNRVLLFCGKYSLWRFALF